MILLLIFAIMPQSFPTFAQDLGHKLGLVIRNVTANLAKEILPAFTAKLSSKYIVIALILILSLGIFTHFGYATYRVSFMKKNLLKYYFVQEKIDNCASMDISDIKSNFIRDFRGIFKINNTLKIAAILAKSDSRHADAINLLRDCRSRFSPEHLNEILNLNILAIQILHNYEKKDTSVVAKIASGKGRFNIIAKELLAESALSEGNYAAYYKFVMDIYNSSDLKTPYAMERFSELNYIAYDNSYL